MVLHEKGLAFETREERLSDLSDELKALHPEAKVPVLLHGDHVLYESSIITQYLNEAFAEPALLPDSPRLKSQIALLTYWCNQHFKHHVDAFKYGLSRSKPEDVEQAPKRLQEGLSRLETLLNESKGLFLFGSFGLADIHVFPFVRQLFRASRDLPDLQTYPKLLDWVARIESRDCFEKAMVKKSHSTQTPS